MAKPMNGRVVLITGGSAGIGRAAALLFARAGANVVLAARSAERGQKVEQEVNAIGPRAQFVQADVSESRQVRALIAQVVQRFGRLDCAFNNAAVLNQAARTGDYEEVDFDVEVSSNLKSVWLCMKYELEQMQGQQPPGGAIVNTSSVNGLGGVANAALYAMSKAGVLALTKSAAQE
jgi:NAD(P)-dependent dehydrogenase (short-subunit alcohol dehydrogenase family)